MVEKFHDKDVRTYEYDNEKGNVERCMTIPDLARMVGYTPGTIWYHVNVRKDDFIKEGYLIPITGINSGTFDQTGRKPQVMLTSDGVMQTLLLLESKRIADPEKRAKVKVIESETLIPLIEIHHHRAPLFHVLLQRE